MIAAWLDAFLTNMASGDNIAATPTSPLAGDGDHFAVTYASARIKFTEAALEVPGCTVYSFRVGGSSTQAKYVAPRQAIEPLGGNPRFNCRGVDNEDLYIDFAVVYGTVDGENPQEGPVEPENMVIHCCGVQGVDGYVGSGAQVALLHDLAADKDSQRSDLLPSDCLVFVHAGMYRAAPERAPLRPPQWEAALWVASRPSASGCNVCSESIRILLVEAK